MTEDKKENEHVTNHNTASAENEEEGLEKNPDESLFWFISKVVAICGNTGEQIRMFHSIELDMVDQFYLLTYKYNLSQID